MERGQVKVQPYGEESGDSREASMTSRDAGARPALTAIRRDKGLRTATYGRCVGGMGMPIPALPHRLQSSPGPQDLRLKPKLDHRGQRVTVGPGVYPLLRPQCCGQRRVST
jgi:hypothetical protein